MTIKYVGFTGHRETENQFETATTLASAIERALRAGASWLACGGCPGWDKSFMSHAIACRDYEDQLHARDLWVGAFIPFPAYWEQWPIGGLEKKLDFIGTVNQGGYSVWKMHARNQFIVDSSDVMIAVYDGRKKGGTYQTLKYARKVGVPIYWISPSDGAGKWIRS